MLTDGFAILNDYARRSRMFAQGLPQREGAIHYWTGIGFSLGNHAFVVPRGEVAEILGLPRLTQVPGVKPWVRGIANVRGRLLPVVDLLGFFGEISTRVERRRRLLVVDRPHLYSGIIVDDVLGMQHFPANNFKDQVDTTLVNKFDTNLVGMYWRMQVPDAHESSVAPEQIEEWPIFSFHKLTDNPAFLEFAG